MPPAPGEGLDFVAFHFFKNGIGKNLFKFFLVVAVTVIFLIVCNWTDFTAAIFVGMFFGFAFLGAAESYWARDKIKSALITAATEIFKAVAKFGQTTVAVLAAIAVSFPNFVRRPQIKIKIQTPTLYPRFVSTPWFARA